jgi:predicted DsbA family dithiol-disulfide isomerase
VTWLPFSLHPEYPPEGLPRAALLRRYGGPFHEQLLQRFADEGLAYNPHPDVVPNTAAALRLSELARDHGRHGVFHDRLMDAYWNDGIDIGDAGELHALAHDLPADDVERVLSSEAYLDRVHASTARAQSIGVNGIPGWLIDGKLLVPGAQPREVFEQVFAQLAATTATGS